MAIDEMTPDEQQQIDEAKKKTEELRLAAEAAKKTHADSVDEEAQAHVDYAAQALETAKAEPTLTTPTAPNHKLPTSTIATGFTLMLIALAGSTKMKLGAEGAMASLTGVMNGMMEGDQAAYKRHMDAYILEVAKIKEDHAARLKHFHITQANDKLTFTEKIKTLGIYAKANGTQEALSMGAYQRQITAEANLINKLDKHHNELKKQYAAHVPKGEEADFLEWEKKPENKGKSRMEHHKEWLWKNDSSSDILADSIKREEEMKSALIAKHGTLDPTKTEKIDGKTVWTFADGKKFNKRGEEQVSLVDRFKSVFSGGK